MNERIRELAEQARVQDRGYFIYQYGGQNGHQSVEKAIDLEKFAELIVRECGVALKSMLRDMVSRGQAYDLIKQHFGVRE